MTLSCTNPFNVKCLENFRYPKNFGNRSLSQLSAPCLMLEGLLTWWLKASAFIFIFLYFYFPFFFGEHTDCCAAETGRWVSSHPYTGLLQDLGLGCIGSRSPTSLITAAYPEGVRAQEKRNWECGLDPDLSRIP